MPASTGSLWMDTALDDGPFARSLQPLRLPESSLIRLWNAVPQPMFFPMSASQFRHQSWHRLHECGNRKHRLCRIVLQRGGPHHLLLLFLGVRAWWKCRALNKMMENHPQKRRPRAGAFVINHQHELQLHAWFFHQVWWTSASIFPPGLEVVTPFLKNHTSFKIQSIEVTVSNILMISSISW